TGTISTVTFPNPEALQIDNRATVVAANSFAGAETLAVQTVAPGTGELTLDLLLPEGYKINDLAPSVLDIKLDGETTSITLDSTTMTIPLTFAAGSDSLQASVNLYYCEAINESLCFIERFAVQVPLEIADHAETAVVEVQRVVVPPEGFGGGIG
ncbi:MAG: hypothetical protein AAF125_20265, partial [Chloroflexota bacterium]